MTIEPGPIAAYLAELAACLPTGPSTRDLLDEASDHLLCSAAAREAEGLDEIAAELAAFRDFGTVDALAAEPSSVIHAMDTRRQARWQLTLTLTLAICGFGVFRIIPSRLASGSMRHRAGSNRARLTRVAG